MAQTIDKKSFLGVRPLPATLSALSSYVLLATWAHSGRLKPASGTWGSLGALPVVLAIWSLTGWAGLAIFAVIVMLAGLWAVPHYSHAIQQEDASEIVIDEVLGLTITFLPLLVASWGSVAVGFIAFRLFDAVKIGPVGWCDRHLPGAWGVMMDDVVAGVFAALCVYGYQYVLQG